MKRQNLLIGMDFGTDSVRAVLIDNFGCTLAVCTSHYRRWGEGKYCDAAANVFRHHPLDYLESMEEVLRGVLRGMDASQLVGIALDATGSTTLAVDASGTPLAMFAPFVDNPNAMFLLWKDHSALEAAARLNEVAANWENCDYRKYSGGRYSSEWYWAKLLHVLRSDPAVGEAAVGWVELGDWLTGELVGNTAPATLRRSRCAAGHKALWHPEWGGLPPAEFFGAMDPMLARFRRQYASETYTADLPAGRISRKWAERLGLPATVVIGGCALDAHAGAVGAQVAPGELVAILGTSACLLAVSHEVDNCIPGICGQVEGGILPGLTGFEAGQSAFGDVFAWFQRLLGYAGKVSLERLEYDAAAIPPGSNGVFALDWFNGRRSPDCDERLTGLLGGLTLGTTVPMAYRALMESTLLGTRAIIDRLKSGGIALTAIKAVGGISRKSALVMQLCADILQMPVAVCANEQPTAIGAAMFAAVSAGLFPSLPIAMQTMGPGFDQSFIPCVEKAKIYDRLYQNYCKLGQTMPVLT